METAQIQHIGNLLKSVLRNLEEMRGPILQKIRWQRGLMVLFLLACVAFIFGLVNEYPTNLLVIAGVIALSSLVATIVLFVQSSKARKAYALAYKQQVYPKLLEVIDPTWQYNPLGMVEKVYFNESGLHSTGWDRYRGDDLVTGKIGTVDFQCSELHVEERHDSTDSDGNTTTTYLTVFKGLFFVGTHQMKLEGKTTVLPFKKKSWIAKVIENIFSIQQPEKVEFLEPPFSDRFMVHSTHPMEARNLISRVQITALNQLTEHIDAERIRIAFLPGKVFCSVSFNKDLFEPRLRGSLLDHQELHEAYDLFTLNKVLVQGLVVDAS